VSPRGEPSARRAADHQPAAPGREASRRLPATSQRPPRSPRRRLRCSRGRSSFIAPLTCPEEPTRARSLVVSVVPAYCVPLDAATHSVTYMSTTAIASVGGTFTPRDELNSFYPNPSDKCLTHAVLRRHGLYVESTRLATTPSSPSAATRATGRGRPPRSPAFAMRDRRAPAPRAAPGARGAAIGDRRLVMPQPLAMQQSTDGQGVICCSSYPRAPSA
jgi:hypothetical protein